MFSIIITEKGGSERREPFEKPEINVGRVQGNDLMLAKGNVSKRHARLLFRDGRFIVTDLKSTNGTYVNGRKIAQATIVREGDKIYIGDFVLRVEVSTAQSTPPHAITDQHPAFDGASEKSASDAHNGASVSSSPDSVTGRRASRPDTADGARNGWGSASSENPDDSPVVPAPPRVPSAKSIAANTIPPPAPTSPNAALLSPTTATPFPTTPSRPSSPVARAVAASAEAAPPSHIQIALTILVERTLTRMAIQESDLTAPADELVTRFGPKLKEQFERMRDGGEIPSAIEPERVLAAAEHELFRMGPLTALLERDDVREIQVMRPDKIIVATASGITVSDVGFTSPQAAARVLSRLCASAVNNGGVPMASKVLRLQHRARLTILETSAHSASGPIFSIRKPARAALSLEDMVRSGTISRAMAGTLSQCVQARANILVVGQRGSGITSLVGALMRMFGELERALILTEDDDLPNLSMSSTLLLDGDGSQNTQMIHSAAMLEPDRLVVGRVTAAMTGELLDAMYDGSASILAGMRAASLRQSVHRIVAELVRVRPGMPLEAAREMVARSFDLVVEIAKLQDGRHRVMRIAQLQADEKDVVVRDVFTFVVERTAAGGMIEGSFHASGAVPSLLEDRASRTEGTPIRRQASR